MTPLAQLFLKQITLPIHKRTLVNDPDGIIQMMGDIHCFEVTDVYEAANKLAQDLHVEHYVHGRFPPKLAFLPAPKTWIEYQNNGKRDAFLLIETKSKTEAELFAAHGAEGKGMGLRAGFIDLLCCDPGDKIIHNDKNNQNSDAAIRIKYLIYAILALINTPKVIGRKQHMPHRGLEKKLISAMKLVGKFPLHAWTEIKLEISPEPHNANTDGVVEAHLTGERALHFCRAHLRVRLGRVEVVRGHWRGDPALGIRRSRYRLEKRN